MTDLMPEQTVDLDVVGKSDVVPPADGLDAVDEQLIARLAGKAREGGLQLAGEGGLLAQLTRRLVESALEGEITDHLGYDRHDAAGRDGGNSRNGHRSKTVLTEVGPVEIDVPRDRDGSFEPRIVAKRQRRLSGVDELVLSLSAKGLTTGEVQAHLGEVYGAQVSRQTISTVTDKVIEGMTEWQNRPLDPVYPVIFIDAIHVKIRDGKVANRPIYVALAVTTEGRREILGLWAGDPAAGGEGAKYWLHVLTEIRNRGVNDVLMIVCDGLTGLPDAVSAVWPQAITQTSSVHNARAGEVPVVTCTVPGRTYADPSPSRSSCRPVRPGRWRASHRSAGAAPTGGWSAEMRFRRGRPRSRGQASKEQHWSTSPLPARLLR
jgi:putative transposase